MISFAPLWKTMKKKKISTYVLRGKGRGSEVPGFIAYPTLKRLRANEHVSTSTIDKLCRILNCDFADIMVYIPDDTISDYNTD